MRCSKCKNPRENPESKYCRKCRAAYNRAWRKGKSLTPLQVTNAAARAKARMFIRRTGIILPPCFDCNTPEKIEAHHPDHARAHWIVPLCGTCHRRRHRKRAGGSSEGALDLKELRQDQEAAGLLEPQKQKANANTSCSRCSLPRELELRRYCNACHAEYMREWRKTHPPTKEQANRHRVQHVAAMYAKRNGIQFEACADCGPAPRLELHHPDYERPHDVVPLCPPCNRRRHRTRRAKDPVGLVNLKALKRENPQIVKISAP